MKKPQTKTENKYDKINGIKISDPYRWLEDAKSLETKKWIKQQNKYSLSKLQTKKFEMFSKELAKNYKTDFFSTFIPVNGKYFYQERKSKEDYAVVYIKKKLEGPPVKLIDLNKNKKANTFSLDYWNVSPLGNYLIYGISENGNEMATLYIKNVKTKENLKEVIPNCRYSRTSWLSDESGFYYTRNPRPKEVHEKEAHLYNKVYFHKIGDDPNEDELIFGKDRPKDDMLHINLSFDNKYLAIHVSQTWSENKVFVYNTETKETKLIIEKKSSKFELRFSKDKVFMFTNYKANNYRLLFTSVDNLYQPIDQWEIFVKEKKFLLNNFYISFDKILLSYLKDASYKMEEFDHKGKKIRNLPIPKYSSILGVSVRKNEKEFFVSITSFVFPRKMYYFNPKINSFVEFKKEFSPIEESDYVVKQKWFSSKDKTKVPMFIIHKKGLSKDKKNPTVFRGYGGFSSLETPFFLRAWVPWLERGGVFVLANIRGGGEFGEKWHKSGIKNKKQNTFDDFIAGAEYLIKNNYTNSEKLGITGGSNGGLLVSAVAMQKPDLFKAVTAIVPLIDMVRFYKFGIASRWIHEYGNPEVEEDLKNILKWSPYHNIKKNINYPNFFFLTAENDTRVYPFHSYKMTAFLQSVEKENEVFLFTQTKTGHGAGKPISKTLQNLALVLSFFADKLKLKI